jgi:hypothetical protein
MIEIKDRKKRNNNLHKILRPFLKRRAIGRINRSYFGGFRVNPSPTNVTFVIIRFHSFSNHKNQKK